MISIKVTGMPEELLGKLRSLVEDTGLSVNEAVRCLIATHGCDVEPYIETKISVDAFVDTTQFSPRRGVVGEEPHGISDDSMYDIINRRNQSAAELLKNGCRMSPEEKAFYQSQISTFDALLATRKGR